MPDTFKRQIEMKLHEKNASFKFLAMEITGQQRVLNGSVHILILITICFHLFNLLLYNYHTEKQRKIEINLAIKS